ncbi:conserved Plasmodium protein, unknown function [Plasmodium relictum]|uniref:Uncharacterized protein n=1 Tax=Plasmodium relictum TaxID=85471 RepID=A0A1J1H1L0_PLARL|nr:conserved Plasmodium protein, unknown function [Plasmodium relictum]CRG98800.1 conserved Plasmodium protein, unknown function [Plasmodium relictum]
MSTDKWNKLYVYNHGNLNKSFENSSSNCHNKNITYLKEKNGIYTDIIFQKSKDNNEKANTKKNDIKIEVSDINKDIKLHVKKLYTRQLNGLEKMDSNMINNSDKATTRNIEFFPTLKHSDYKIINSQIFNINKKIDPVYSNSELKNNLSLRKNPESHISTHENVHNNLKFANYPCAIRNNDVKTLLHNNLLFLSGLKNEHESNLNVNKKKKINNFIKNKNDLNKQEIENEYLKSPIISKENKVCSDSNKTKLYSYVEPVCNGNTNIFLNKEKQNLLNDCFLKNNTTNCNKNYVSEETNKENNFNKKFIYGINNQESITHHDNNSKFKKRNNDVEYTEKCNINISKLIHSYKEYQKKKQEEANTEILSKFNKKKINNSINENKFSKRNKNIDKNNINEHCNLHEDSIDKVKLDNGIIANEIEIKSCAILKHSNEVSDNEKNEGNLFNSLNKSTNKLCTQDSDSNLCFNKKYDKIKKKKKKKNIADNKNNFNYKTNMGKLNDSLNCTVLNDSYFHRINDTDYIYEHKKDENKKNNHNDKIDNLIYKNKIAHDSMNSFLCKKVLEILKSKENIIFNKPDKTIIKEVNKDIDSSKNLREDKKEIIHFDNDEKNKKCKLNSSNNNKSTNDSNENTNYINNIYSDNTYINKNINNNISNNCSNNFILHNASFSNSNISSIENFKLYNHTLETFTSSSNNNTFNLINFKNGRKNNSVKMKKLKDNTISKNYISYKKEIKSKKVIFEKISMNNEKSKLKNYSNSIDNTLLNNNEINFISNEDLNSFDILCEKNINNVENFCLNDIIVKDIEEKKMNKLFFEEICVFRLNEKNDIYDYNSQPVNLFHNRSLSNIDLTKLEINKKHYKDINDEVKNLIKKEDAYEIEMNIGLVFRKFIPVTMNLSCNYLLIKKNEKNIITCISYSNILEINMLKKNERRKIFLFKLVYVFKKKKQSEKKVTLLFRTNKIEVYNKIKSKVEPILMKESKNKEYIDIETVYSYIIEKYKKMHILYLRQLLQNVEKILRKFIFKLFFHKLKLKHAYLKKIEYIKKQRSKLIQGMMDKLEFSLRKKLQNYFNLLLIKTYEKSIVNYQVKTNSILFNMIIKEKTVYQEKLDKQNTYLLFNVLYSLYKKKMTNYFNYFVNNNRILSKGKNAFSYTITHLNSILLEYDRRIKCFVLSKLKFNYDHISYFSFVMYKLYFKRIFLGYLRIRDNRLNVKFFIEKNVYNLVRIISKTIENQKYYAFLKLQKHIFQEKERKNKIICDNLIYANNELCNNLDKIAIEKGINKLECIYKFKVKENLVKYYYRLKGPQINNKHFNHCLKYCSIFVYILSKIIQRKVHNSFYFFVLKCFQDNNKSRLIYSMKMLELILIKKNKRYILDLLKFYDKYPYLFKYRHLSKIEVFIISIENFIYFCNKKLLLNFILKLHYLKYQGRIIKAYTCIGNLYKFIDIIHQKIQSHIYEPFRLLLQNAQEKNHKMIKEKLNIKKTQLKISNNKIPSMLSFKNDDTSSNRLNLMKKYPLFFYNSDISPDCTTIADDKLSLQSNDSISNIFSYAYEDMDKIKRKIYDFNTKISHVNL